MKDILEAVGLLTPYDIDIPKIRLGPPSDGGYIFADCITPEQTIISYGISDEYRFDTEMAERGHRVFMFDHTIDGIAHRHPNMFYFREGVAAETDEAALVYSVADHLWRYRIEGGRLILKMDVEGAEFDSLIAVPDEVLLRFEQIVFEVHQLPSLGESEFRDRFCTLFEKLNRHFTLFHIHANNHDGPFQLTSLEGIIIPDILELSYIRTAKVTRRASQTLYPTPLDYPNVPQRDKLLWFYPFLPTAVQPDEFRQCLTRVNAQQFKRDTPAS